jgi:hypothetical protein
MSFLSNLFGKSQNEPTQEQLDNYYQLKQKGIENILGDMHNIVGHAIIPFEVGGADDMYYFFNHIPGTGFATMELLNFKGSISKPNKLGTYELVAFTKYEYNTNAENPTPFDKIERRMCGLFTAIGSYSNQAVFNPKETCEIPTGENEENAYVVFDNYQPADKKFVIGKKVHHLLLCLCVFKSEMEFARTNGSDQLFARLKAAGHYPYSDLDREPVV